MPPLIVFGAFDRHNFGDLLFAHVAAALAPARELRFAGLAARDLRRWGGHRVEAIRALAHEYAGREVEVLHAGGELLACSAWEAAVMLQEVNPGSIGVDAEQCAQRALGLTAHAPYCAGRALFPQARLVYRAVGGVELVYRDEGMQREVLEKLRMADAVTVRDRRTAEWLSGQGLCVPLIPDPACLTAELFHDRIAAAPAASMRAQLGRPYAAVQLSAAFHDAGTLDTLAAALNAFAAASGWGIVLFLAGTAPWHDDPACTRRLLERLATPHACLLESMDVWDICALLAGASLYAGSSLHGRIVAMAYGVPRIGLVPQRVALVEAKQAAYAASWDVAGMPGAVTPAELATAIPQALATDGAVLQALAVELGRKFRNALA